MALRPSRSRIVSPAMARSTASFASTSETVIPFDYAARFELSGEPGNIVQDVINISPDGVFVAVAIGYGLLENRTERIELDLDNRVPGEIKLGELPQAALVEGLRVDPHAETIVFQGDLAENNSSDVGLDFSPQAVPLELINKCFQFIRRPHEISFLFSMVDSSTGREMQDEPTHNIASLGTSTGERPFRRLAQPVSFLPRSTVRMQVIERTPDVKGSLFIVLYGYKVVLSSACPEPAARMAVEAAMRGVITPFVGDRHVIPFDYVVKFTLTGRPGNPLQDEVTINTEGGFVATSIGYGLAVEEEGVEIRLDRAPKDSNTAKDPNITLQDLPLNALPPDVVRAGFRIRPDYLRIAIDAGGNLRQLRWSLANQIFERLNDPDDVSFLYSIADTGVGRDWQNRLIYNVAGLGIANGLRPFKRLERPRIFPPRATIQVDIEEKSGLGTLFLAFQGYKILGGSRLGGMR